MTRVKREVLNSLSKEVYGASGYWQTILKRGVIELVKEVPATKLKYKKGAKGRAGRPPKVLKTTKIKWYTAETVEALMLELKARNDAMKAELKANETNSKGS